ncbi:hypothetical protein RF11_05745 [Thelohanellus kitauei]|uniref:Secreted protein n=1 Tax=Thelohanellus kitauei TaxID=669202 RepID=A0A0C2ND96_THEKT|nr:hypothetical protein RF11_05745 [Thelohanellus kitauei]
MKLRCLFLTSAIRTCISFMPASNSVAVYRNPTNLTKSRFHSYGLFRSDVNFPVPKRVVNVLKSTKPYRTRSLFASLIEAFNAPCLNRSIRRWIKSFPLQSRWC